MWTTETDRAPADGALKVVLEPKVTLLAATGLAFPTFLEMMKHELSFTELPELNNDDGFDLSAAWLIEFAGRECYQSWHNPAERTSDDYVRNIIKQAHYSVLEHVNVTFRLEGISRSLTHELIRHRHFSFSQLSQRYVDSRDTGFVCPPLYLKDIVLFQLWEECMRQAQENLVLLERRTRERFPHLPQKEIREAVRGVAPNSIDTKLILTGNLRTFLEFFPKRLSVSAEAEIRRLAEVLYRQLNELYPFVFENVGAN